MIYSRGQLYVYAQWLFGLKKIHSTIDAPPGFRGVSKNHIFYKRNCFNFAKRLPPQRHKLQKPSKLKKKWQKKKKSVFSDFFEYSSIWGQS